MPLRLLELLDPPPYGSVRMALRQFSRIAVLVVSVVTFPKWSTLPETPLPILLDVLSLPSRPPNLLTLLVAPLLFSLLWTAPSRLWRTHLSRPPLTRDPIPCRRLPATRTILTLSLRSVLRTLQWLPKDIVLRSPRPPRHVTGRPIVTRLTALRILLTPTTRAIKLPSIPLSLS